jgi:hypothetical protein
MQDEQFEWDDDKAAEKLKPNGFREPKRCGGRSG